MKTDSRHCEVSAGHRGNLKAVGCVACPPTLTHPVFLHGVEEATPFKRGLKKFFCLVNLVSSGEDAIKIPLLKRDEYIIPLCRGVDSSAKQKKTGCVGTFEMENVL
jgi:hypothetical protein